MISTTIISPLSARTRRVLFFRATEIAAKVVAVLPWRDVGGVHAPSPLLRFGVTKKGLQLLGMFAPELDQPRKDAQDLWPQMMFDGLDFQFYRFRAKAEQLEQFSQCFVSHFDVLGNGAAFEE